MRHDHDYQKGTLMDNQYKLFCSWGSICRGPTDLSRLGTYMDLRSRQRSTSGYIQTNSHESFQLLIVKFEQELGLDVSCLIGLLAAVSTGRIEYKLTMSRTLSMTFGRPSAIPDNYSRIPLPEILGFNSKQDTGQEDPEALSTIFFNETMFV